MTQSVVCRISVPFRLSFRSKKRSLFVGAFLQLVNDLKGEQVLP